MQLLECAPAKLNLMLHITGKRPDGYHLLDSMVAFVEHGDRLMFQPAEKLSLNITGKFAGNLSGDNLIMRAARILQQTTGCDKGAAIILDKQIPVGAGLGGGSSDAAAALRGLLRLWELTMDDGALHGLALSLGSDVPVCLARRLAVIRGIGDEITPVEYPLPYTAVLVNPGVPLLTADVYRRFSGSFSPAAGDTDFFRGHNALEAPAMALCPAIGDVLAALRATENCALARMSGSGATCFGLYATADDATRAASRIQDNHPGWWTVATSFSRNSHG